MTGTYTSPTFPVALSVTGTIAYRLVQGPTSGFFNVTQGSINGTSSGGVAFVGTLSGSVDCMGTDSVSIVGGYSYNGTSYTFAGVSNGSYEDGAVANGTWQVTESASATYGGSGSWSASWSGP